jgi:hypothetical protein
MPFNFNIEHSLFDIRYFCISFFISGIKKPHFNEMGLVIYLIADLN